MNYLAIFIPGFDDELLAPGNIPTTDNGKIALEKLIQGGISLFLILCFIAALFMLVYAGIQWVMSEGDKQKLASARGRITYTIIGLIIILLAFFIVNFIGNFFSVGNVIGGT